MAQEQCMKDQGNLVAIEDEQEQMYLVDYLKRMGKIAFLYSMNGVAFKFVTKFRCFFILSFPKLVKLCMRKWVFERFTIMVSLNLQTGCVEGGGYRCMMNRGSA